MCGILGCLPAVDAAPFGQVLNLLAHRGPDGYGIWTHPQNRITLGHRRLAILDLSPTGAQPMHYANRYTLTYNGEIYNFAELRQTLQTLGYHFTSQTDAEVILAAFMQWGHNCWQHFNGMWALAIWDNQTQQLILCRDRFGEKPLYYTLLPDGRFAFASEMKALAPFLPHVELNPLFDQLQQNVLTYEATQHCLLRYVNRFPAGHWGVFAGGNLLTQPYWNTLAHLHPVPKRFEEQTEAFAALFTDACRLRMRAHVPIGTALSGGLDSSAVICTMAHAARSMPPDAFASPSLPHAFIASMTGTPLDETAYARQVTDFLQIPATFVPISAQEGLNQLPQYLYLAEDLYITSPVPMMQTYHAAKQQGVSVCIDGHGADELFCGYDTFMFHAFLDCGFNPQQINNLLHTYRNLAPPTNPQFAKPPVSFANYFRWVCGSPSLLRWLPHLPKEWVKAFLPKLPRFTPNPPQNAQPQQLGHLNSALYRLFHTDNLPTLLRNYDRYSMASGVEIRMPFLDHRVVSFCFSVPYTSKFRNGYTKALLRYAIAPFMPPKVAFRTYKMGFQTPIANWMKGEWQPFFLDTLHETGFTQYPHHQPDMVKQQILSVINHPNPTYRQAEIAYSAINPYLWHKFVFTKLTQLPKITW